MKYIPILFNPEMVAAIMDGRKIMTRRIAKEGFQSKVPCHTGDILWVRETWAQFCINKNTCRNALLSHDDYCYKAGPDVCIDEFGCSWHPSIHMPKEAARIFLRVTDVFLQHVNPIKPIHAQWEGAKDVADFARIWDSTIPKDKLDQYGYDADPWVWVIMFERIPKPEGWPNA